MRGHQLNEECSVWLHRAVADKARRKPEILSKARERVEGWLLDGSVHPRYAEAWRRLLSAESEEVLRNLVAPGRRCVLSASARLSRELSHRESDGGFCARFERLMTDDPGAARAHRTGGLPYRRRRAHHRRKPSGVGRVPECAASSAQLE